MQQPPLSASDITAEREDLEELVRSAGWKRFVLFVKERYQGGGYFSAMGTLLREAQSDPTKMMKPMVYQETASEVLRILTYPEARVNDITEAR